MPKGIPHTDNKCVDCKINDKVSYSRSYCLSCLYNHRDKEKRKANQRNYDNNKRNRSPETSEQKEKRSAYFKKYYQEVIKEKRKAEKQENLIT
jgi:hypothetical protein